MANDDTVNALGGLRPLQQPYGAVRNSLYQLTTSATLGLFVGEPVQLDASGRVAVYTTGGDLAKCIGSVVGFSDTDKAGLPSSLTSLTQAAYLIANRDAYVAVADDPDQLFVIQCESGSLVTQSSIGNTARMLLRQSNAWTDTRGSIVTGSSWFELSGTDLAGDTGGTLQVVGIGDTVNADGTINTTSANYVKAVVRIYHHQFRGDTT